MDASIIQCGDLVVTPVTTEYHLAQAYLRMLEEGTLSTVFYESAPTLRDYLNDYMTAGRRVTLSCFRLVSGKQPELCGLGWAFNAVRMGDKFKAEVGMWFARRQTRQSENLKFGQMMLECFFTQHNIDVIFGFTPEANKLALRYSQKLGFDLIGPVPDMCSWNGALAPGWISHLAKSQWTERR